MGRIRSSMVPHRRLTIFALIVIAISAVASSTIITAQDATDKSWHAVAPGRVEPVSGEVRVGSAALARIGAVLVKVNDTVFAGEPLMRLEDDEVRTRHAKAELQVKLRQRARPRVDAKTAERRRFEDAAYDAERAVVAARAALDKAAAAKRTGDGSDNALATARKELAEARERASQRQAELTKFEADGPVVLPTELEGQFAMARIELLGAEAALDNLTIRSPIDGTVLQINVRPGELAAPSAPQPLIVVGDVSRLRVRAEIDERDYGAIKIGQGAVVRSPAFPGRDVAGKVVAIAPVVEPGRVGGRGSRSLTDVNVAEVLVDLAEAGPLAVGMKVDVYFRRDASKR